jgi:hypothetical protein
MEMMRCMGGTPRIAGVAQAVPTWRLMSVCHVGITGTAADLLPTAGVTSAVHSCVLTSVQSGMPWNEWSLRNGTVCHRTYNITLLP